MRELTLQLSDDVLNRLQSEAQCQQMPLDDLVREIIENYLDKPTKDELLEDLHQSMLDALAGQSRPADEVIEELRRKYPTNANNS